MPDIITTLRAAGFDTRRLPGTLVPGKFYRLPAPGKGKSDKNGWVKLHGDGVASYGDWTTGERHTWRAANDNPQRRDPVVDAARRDAQDRARAAAAASAANAASRIWENAKPATEHPYLSRKGIALDGLRVDLSGRLLVPVIDARTGALASVQRIDRDGQKRFLKDTTTDAGHYIIPGGLPRIFVEGLATGATIHAATGREVVVCFNAGNLKTVAAILAQPGDSWPGLERRGRGCHGGRVRRGAHQRRADLRRMEAGKDRAERPDAQAMGQGTGHRHRPRAGSGACLGRCVTLVHGRTSAGEPGGNPRRSGGRVARWPGSPGDARRHYAAAGYGHGAPQGRRTRPSDHTR